ncbi:MAG: T9SS type A sorting domain-containing protein [Candidatus Delongbacteria bacterium]|jgi:hypothetical protein|nr:T9SS type A sorting domain-containing protein [Candidatus Delongbacteria bacterium]
MTKFKVIILFIIIFTSLMLANPFSIHKENLGSKDSSKVNFSVVNPLPDFTMSRAMPFNDSVIDLYTSNVFSHLAFSDSVFAENINIVNLIYVFENVDTLDNVLSRGIDFWVKDNVGRSNITLTAYADSTRLDSASDTFQVAVEDTSMHYKWYEGGSNYNFQHNLGSDSISWKAAAHFSLGSESFILKQIEFGFELPENIEWKIVKFDEVPIDSIIIGSYVNSLEINPCSPTYQVIDDSFPETILTGDIAIVFSTEGNFMPLDPNGESSNTWIWTERDGWVLTNSYTSDYDGAWYAGMQLEKIINIVDVDTLNVGFESGSFEGENKYWEVKCNTSSDGGLDGTNLSYPIPGKTWMINSSDNTNLGSNYIRTGDYSAAIQFDAPDFNWLISPGMELDYDDYILKFWVWFKSSDYPTKFYVMVNDFVNGWTNVLSYDGSTPDNMFQSEVEVPLADYVGKVIRVAFVTENSDSNSVAVDDIKIWSRTVGIHEAFLPASTVLHQNYPNPFNPTTEINFTLNHNSLTKLTVYNTKGEMVKILNNSKLAKGSYSYSFDGQDLNSGLYFYQLEVEGVRSTKKMILMK